METTPKTKKIMSKDEVALLVDLVQNNPILTSKETNAVTNQIKDAKWTSLTNNYNARTASMPTTVQQLKLKWDNLKKNARKRAQQIRMNNLQTGGDKPEFIPPDEILEKVAGLLGSTCSGFEVPFGGDGVGFSGDGIRAESWIIDGEVGGGGLFLDEGTQYDGGENKDLEVSTVAASPKKQIIKRKMSEGDENCSSSFNPLEFPKSPKNFFATPSKQLQMFSVKTAKKKTEKDGKSARNLAIANYYNKKAEKMELEIKLLMLQLANKENCNCNLNSPEKVIV